jgi:hypothetical protein
VKWQLYRHLIDTAKFSDGAAEPLRRSAIRIDSPT